MDEADQVQPAESTDRRGCATIGSLLTAIPCYLLTATIVGFEKRNPEDGMLIGFMMIAEIPLWIALAVFLRAATARAQLPKAAVVAMWVLVPIAAAACWTAFELMGTRPSWIAVAPLLLPILAFTFGLWAKRTAHKPFQERRAATIQFGAAALALCLVPPIGYAQWMAGAPEREAQRVQEEREQARLAAAMEARCAALGPQSPLETYLDFLEGGYCGDKARTVLAQSPRRQGDAVHLLNQGGLDRLKSLHSFQLEPTPELCRSYAGAIDRRIGELRAAATGYHETYSTSYEQIANLGWFMAHGCDLSAQLRQLAAAYRANREGGSEVLAAGFDEILGNGVRTAPATAN